MYSQLFEFELPEFLSNMLGIDHLIIYSYPLCILLGALFAVYILRKRERESQYAFYSIQLVLLLVCSALLGGKLFLFFEKPLYYYKNPEHIIEIMSGGYVFYGSFMVCMLVFIVYLKRMNKSILKSLDIIAVSIPILHAFGRIGCFLAGCCYGKRTEFGVIFPKSDPYQVHPTQLYEASFLFLLFVLLNILYKRKKFDGAVCLVYIMSYGIGRFIIEYFRGDNRGYLITNLISHSQFISLILIASTILLYFKMKHKTLKIS